MYVGGKPRRRWQSRWLCGGSGWCGVARQRQARARGCSGAWRIDGRETERRGREAGVDVWKAPGWSHDRVYRHVPGAMRTLSYANRYVDRAVAGGRDHLTCSYCRGQGGSRRPGRSGSNTSIQFNFQAQGGQGSAPRARPAAGPPHEFATRKIADRCHDRVAVPTFRGVRDPLFHKTHWFRRRAHVRSSECDHVACGSISFSICLVVYQLSRS